MIATKVDAPVLREGDEVVLTDGPYKGSLGVFIGLRDDPNWADIKGRDGKVMAHPVEWLARSTAATPGRES